MMKNNTIIIALLALIFLAACSRPEDTDGGARSDVETVVLLHGLARTSKSMDAVEKMFKQSGYHVENIGYPSTRKSVKELTEFLDHELSICCLDLDRPLHFVTHSLGGILLRAYLAEHRPPHLGRVVMLSPPNKGSEVVDTWGDTWLFKSALGPAALELGTGDESIPNNLGPADFELGIITGSRTINPVTSWLISGVDDGAVAVDSAKLEGMGAFLVVPHTHTFIMKEPRVISEAIQFIRTGHFRAIPRELRKAK